MPFPTSRIDLLLVPRDTDHILTPSARCALWEALGAGGIADEEGWPGAAASELVEGGFRRLRLDDPGKIVLYANGQGGFTVRCPRAGTPVVMAFQRAMQRLREGGARQLDCPACHGEHLLEDLRYAPPARFARWALVVGSVQAVHPKMEGMSLVERYVGPMEAVVRRVA